jgi:hypothetical protein
MSDEQLDNEFKKRIKEVFDHYEDDTPHEGWALLREKYPEKNSNRVVAWLWRYAAVAAILLAFLSVGLWFNLQHKDIKNQVAKNGAHKGPVMVNPAAVVKNTPGHTASPVSAARQNAVAATAAHQPVQPAVAGVAVVQPNNRAVQHLTNNPTINNGPASPTQINGGIKSAVAYQPAAGSVPVTTGVKIPGTDNTQTSPVVTAPVNDNAKSPAIAKQQAGPVIAMLDTTKHAPAPAAKKQPDRSMQSMFDNDSKYAAAHNRTDETKIKTRSVVFGVYAATYFNYAKGSNDQFNAGGGISADIKLTKNLSIVTGVAIAQNSFNYNSITGTAPATSLAPTLAMTNVKYGTAASLSRLNPTSNGLNASLVGLDVPVDLKYIFNPKTGNLYMAAGLSSGGFINETYNYSTTYNIDNNAQPTQDATTRKSFDNFYFAKMVNLSFGVGYPMGNGSKLFIEPFVKYPITGMGDQHILFGSGGVNLKFNFDGGRLRR